MSIYGELDELDIGILRLLQSNARLSYRGIASRLGVSPATVLVRLKKLRRKGVLKGFTIVLDPYKLGYNSLAFILVKTDPRRTKYVAARLLREPFITEIHEVTGDYHLLVKVWAKDNVDLANIIDRIRLVDGVVDTNTLYVLRIVKETRNPL